MESQNHAAGRVRRTSVARAERRLRMRLAEVDRGERDPAEVWASLRAVFGHFGHADTFRLKERILRRIGLLHDGLPRDDPPGG